MGQDPLGIQYVHHQSNKYNNKISLFLIQKTLIDIQQNARFHLETEVLKIIKHLEIEQNWELFAHNYQKHIHFKMYKVPLQRNEMPLYFYYFYIYFLFLLTFGILHKIS